MLSIWNFNLHTSLCHYEKALWNFVCVCKKEVDKLKFRLVSSDKKFKIKLNQQRVYIFYILLFSYLTVLQKLRKMFFIPPEFLFSFYSTFLGRTSLLTNLKNVMAEKSQIMWRKQIPECVFENTFYWIY